MEEITRKKFDELVAVGEIELTPSEAEQLFHEMNAQMKIFEQLEAIPADALSPMIYGDRCPDQEFSELREDHPSAFENAVGIIAQAPRSRGGYIVSPDLAHQKLG